MNSIFIELEMRIILILTQILLLSITFRVNAAEISSDSLNRANNDEFIHWHDDKFRGTRTYETKQRIVINDNLKLSAYATSSNYGKNPPSTINLYFLSQSDEWEYMDYHPIILLVDGKRFSWPEKSFRWNGNVGNGYVLEHMHLDLSPSLFRKIAFAKTVEGKIGLTEFTLEYEDREAFRSMSTKVLRLR